MKVSAIFYYFVLKNVGLTRSQEKLEATTEFYEVATNDIETLGMHAYSYMGQTFPPVLGMRKTLASNTCLGRNQRSSLNRLSDGSVFSQNFDEGPRTGGAITNLAGATLDVPEDITFSGNSVVCSSSINATPPPHRVIRNCSRIGTTAG